MLSCVIGDRKINIFDSEYSPEQLRKWSNKGILLCPACGKPYEYCHGRVVTPYFRHKDKEECNDKFSESETEEHINGKRDLYEWIKRQNGVTDVELEAWIPETCQRPDIMFKYLGRKYVIEYQCSPIATEYFERHELYQAAGIIDIWICGTEKYLKYGMREKTIGKSAIGYYNSSKKSFIRNDISIDESYMYYAKYIPNIKIEHNYYFNDSMYELPLNDFEFAFSKFIYKKSEYLLDELNKSRKKRKYRSSNKPYEIGENKHKGYHNKYLIKRNDKYYSLCQKIENHVSELSNKNWNFSVTNIYGLYKTFEYLEAKPIIEKINNEFISYECVKLFNLSIKELSDLAYNEEKLKSCLLELMKKNKSKVIEEYKDNEDIRIFWYD